MTGNNYYCSGSHCRRTTSHVRVRMQRKTYLYCVRCGRRLEAVAEAAAATPATTADARRAS